MTNSRYYQIKIKDRTGDVYNFTSVEEPEYDDNGDFCIYASEGMVLVNTSNVIYVIVNEVSE